MTVIPKLILILLCIMIFPLKVLSGTPSALHVIELEHRPATEIQALIAPLLAPDDRVIASGFKLLINAPPHRIAEITAIIAELDAIQENLLISVIQSRTLTVKKLNAGIQVRSNTTHLSPPKTTTDIRAYLEHQQKQQTDQQTQKIRTLDGQTAYIQAGQIRPIQTTTIYPGKPHQPYRQTSEYVPATSGFAVTPRLNGNQVMLDIEPWSQKFNRREQISTQGMHSTIRTQLGRWVEIGVISEQQRSSANGLIYSKQNSQNQNMKTFVRVDKQ